MRNPSHLSPDKAFEERVHLTSFMLDVKALVEKWSRRRGHKIGVSVRTPTHPDACAGVGIDVIDWAHRGVVDLIVATPFYFSSDFDIPFHLWKERLQGTPKRVSVIGGICPEKMSVRRHRKDGSQPAQRTTVMRWAARVTAV